MIPTDAYWAAIDWKALGIATTGVLALATPFFKSWWEGRVALSSNNTRSRETATDRLDRLSREHLAAVVAERDRWQGQAGALVLELAAVDADRDACWAAARAMEDVAHEYRHRAAAAQTEADAMLHYFEKLSRGDLPPERVARVLEFERSRPPLPVAPSLHALKARRTLPT